MINSRSLDDLDDDTKAKAKALMKMAEAEGVKILIYSTFRDRESQDSIYAQGRTKPGRKVTQARGGSSFHQYRVAFDFVPLGADGNPNWNDKKKFEKVGAMASKLGMFWGGNFQTFKDMPHVQNTHGLSLKQFQALYPERERPASEKSFLRKFDTVLKR
jgi:peptidoglycan L-alanyl-D-glutamate endopeptidase CwlK